MKAKWRLQVASVALVLAVAFGPIMMVLAQSSQYRSVHEENELEKQVWVNTNRIETLERWRAEHMADHTNGKSGERLLALELQIAQINSRMAESQWLLRAISACFAGLVLKRLWEVMIDKRVKSDDNEDEV